MQLPLMRYLVYLVLAFLIVGCGPQRDLVYFSNLEEEDINRPDSIENGPSITIQPDDLLSITVNSLSVESNTLFNQGVIGTLGSSMSGGTTGSTAIEGYLVDNEGYINFPVIGRIHLGGLTKGAATDTIRNILNRDYVKDPTVNIRYLNFTVTVVGEVENPMPYIVETEKINVVEAIAMAGGMTTVGKRENVLIIREQDGVRTLLRVNLNDKEALNSPDYYLQQNDIIYVEPDSYKAATASLTRTNIQFVLSLTLAALTITTLVIALSN